MIFSCNLKSSIPMAHNRRLHQLVTWQAGIRNPDRNGRYACVVIPVSPPFTSALSGAASAKESGVRRTLKRWPHRTGSTAITRTGPLHRGRVTDKLVLGSNGQFTSLGVVVDYDATGKLLTTGRFTHSANRLTAGFEPHGND